MGLSSARTDVFLADQVEPFDDDRGSDESHDVFNVHYGDWDVVLVVRNKGSDFGGKPRLLVAGWEEGGSDGFSYFGFRFGVAFVKKDESLDGGDERVWGGFEGDE